MERKQNEHDGDAKMIPSNEFTNDPKNSGIHTTRTAELLAGKDKALSTLTEGVKQNLSFQELDQLEMRCLESGATFEELHKAFLKGKGW